VNVRPSGSVTLISSALRTTWSLVSTVPAASTITPEPSEGISSLRSNCG
jgi:hypothetical protein